MSTQTKTDLAAAGLSVKLSLQLRSRRRENINHIEAEWKTVQSFLARLASIDHPYQTAVFGLLALYDAEGELGEHIGGNWLGTFVFDLLCEVALEGAGNVANDPDKILNDLKEAISGIRGHVETAQEILHRYDGIAAAPVTPGSAD